MFTTLIRNTSAAMILTTTAALANPLSATATTDLNVRSGPGPVYPVVGMIDADATANINGCVADMTWCSVNVGGVDGWAFAEYLRVDADGDGDAINVENNGDAVDVVVLEYDEASPEAQAAAGAGVGAVIGGLIAGPVGAAAGAVLGAATSDQAQPDQRIIAYVDENPLDPVYLDGEVVVGATVPETVEVYALPDDANFAYLNINGQTVLVDRSDRGIVRVIR